MAGCTRTWLLLSNKALALGGTAPSSPDDPAAGMCDPCRNKFKDLKDQQRRCDRPGCTGTWTWSVQAQLEAFATRRPPPKMLCSTCETRLSELQDKEVDCVVPGCSRKALLTKKQQLLAEAQAAEAAATPAPEAAAEQTGGQADGEKNGHAEAKEETTDRVTYTGPMCEPCTAVSSRIKDRQVNCGINGCKRKWIWKADEQIQTFAAGKPDQPPRRMCPECRAEFGKLLDREVKCRTSGCKKTWTWSRSDQLDACVAGKSAPKAPARMCESCFQTFSGLKDVERPCRRSGCKGTWLDRRGAQLARAVRGKVGDPYPRYCTNCEKELGELQDREVGCKTEGCQGTWTWTREQQLAAGVRPMPKAGAEGAGNGASAEGASAPEAPVEAAAAEAAAPESAEPAANEQSEQEAAPTAAKVDGAPHANGKKKRRRKRRREVQPPEKKCAACVEFLAGRKTLEIPCSQCNTPIYWPPESQLQTHLGNWAAPTLCGACKRDATEAARIAAKEALRAHVTGGGLAATAEAEPVEAAPAPAPEGEPEPSASA